VKHGCSISLPFPMGEGPAGIRPSSDFSCEPSPDGAGNRDHFGCYQSCCLRLDPSALTEKLLPAQKRRAAASVVLSILIILVVSALIGLKVLSISAFH
jgi:hypothetical protein